MTIAGHTVNPPLVWAGSGVLALLIVATLVGLILKATVKDRASGGKIDNLDAQIRGWWVMFVIFGLTLVVGQTGALVLFGFISFFALREYLSLVATRRADHRILFWTFFIFTPLQYYLLSIQWLGFFIVIPVYAFLFIPAAMALHGDSKSFLERAAKIQWGLMLCVYCLSYAPALLLLKIDDYGPDAKLLLFLVIVDQFSRVLQYAFGSLFGRHKIAPSISPSKTWEGSIGGVLGATLVGTAIWWLTPFSIPIAALISFTIALLGLAGRLVMAAIKRDQGVKEYGTMIAGRGMLDRMDSLIFAAPVFFHIVRFFYALP